MASHDGTNYECLGHFNMELFYFSEILETFSLNSPHIDATAVNYLMKIVQTIDGLLQGGKAKKIYNPKVKFNPEIFDRVTLQRNFHCSPCNHNVPFLWTDFLKHSKECGKKTGSKTKNKPLNKKTREVRERHSMGSQSSLLSGNSSSLASLASYHDDNFKTAVAQKAKVLREKIPKASRGKEKDELKKQRKEFKELQKLIKAKNKQKKADAKKQSYTTIKKKTMLLLKMVDETMNQNVAIGEKIINLSVYKEITDDLEKILGVEYPDVKVYVFGSRKTGLGTQSGDLDLFVDVKNHYNMPLQSKEENAEIIEKVHELLGQSNSNWDKLVSITKARTPILKAFNTAHKIPCDLSFTNGLSHLNTSLIRYLLTLQPDCHKVACFVKAWYKSVFSARYEVNKVSSYMITLLVIFYMQTIKLLPPICDLQDCGEKPLMIGDWQGDFCKPTLTELKMELSSNARKILIGFFHFYHNFDYGKYVVCPLLGQPIERTLFDTPELLPQSMNHYKMYVQKMEPSPENAKELLATDTSMCVQDPLELCHNVAKGIHIDLFGKFTILCEKSRQILLEVGEPGE